MKNYRPEDYAPYLFLLAMILTVAIFRPPLPIDETRYLTVAWEMFLDKNYALLSLNFQPYHHKPPMLFWLINLCWSVFGVSREAALVPVFAASASFVFLSQKLSRRLFPDRHDLVPWIMLATVPFVIYSTLLMFDILIGVFVLAVLIVMLDYMRTPKKSYILAAGVLTGLAVLTKGPVAYLYILWPMVLYPLWRFDDMIVSRKLYSAILAMIAVSIMPVLFWLVPLMGESDKNFAYWLLWEQTAGRISGNFNAAHARPFYFYLMLLPVIFMPWIFLPRVWKRLSHITTQDRGIRFLACWTLPVFLSFCLISGKQPHYLVPLIPAVVLLLSRLLNLSDKKAVIGIGISLFILFVAGHIIADKVFFNKLNPKEIVAFMQAHPDKDYAYVRNYQGEFGFAARLKKPLATLTKDDLPAWFAAHPDGYAIVRYKVGEDMSRYHEVYSGPYRGKQLGIYKYKD